MKVFLLWKFYPDFLANFHIRNSDARDVCYDALLARLREYYPVWPLEIFFLLKSRGWDCRFAVANDNILQDKWAEENSFDPGTSADRERNLVMEQIRRFRPDVLWLPMLRDYYGGFVREALQYCGKVITWVGEPWPTPPDLSGISVLITENPATYRERHNSFDRVIVTKPGFPSRLLEVLRNFEKKRDIVFVGQFSGVHKKRAEIVAHLIRSGIRVEVHGWAEDDGSHSLAQGLRLASWYGIKRRTPRRALSVIRRTIAATPYERDVGVIREVLQPAVFGMDMYRLLAESRIVLNVHADIVAAHAGNMRMFEATGVGACLVAERLDNMASLFEPNKEVIVFESKEDAVDVVRSAIDDRERALSVGAAGQTRTLKDHTMERFLEAITPAFELMGP